MAGQHLQLTCDRCRSVSATAVASDEAAPLDRYAGWSRISGIDAGEYTSAPLDLCPDCTAALNAWWQQGALLTS